ncbi:hypothetical protein HYW76_02510 [Candidatus Pacearchaeota archaeon]|nr:hypothetical protein [Candidatus Pacearchaeota archaeon]
MEDKVSGLSDKEEREVFLSYLDDNDKVVSGFVILIECNGFVVFKTNQNIIRIPSHRVLKIKERVK